MRTYLVNRPRRVGRTPEAGRHAGAGGTRGARMTAVLARTRLTSWAPGTSVSWVAAFGIPGPTFTAMLSRLTGMVTNQQAADISGLFNTTTRVGGVIGTAAFGTVYLALAPTPGQAIHGFAALNLMLAATALAAGSLAALSIRRGGDSVPGAADATVRSD